MRRLLPCKAELKQCQDRLAKLFEGDVAKEFAQEDRARIVRLAARTRTTMQEFLRRATERKIDRLSGLITESFRFLLRKKSMVERILIDPATLRDHPVRPRGAGAGQGAAVGGGEADLRDLRAVGPGPGARPGPCRR